MVSRQCRRARAAGCQPARRRPAIRPRRAVARPRGRLRPWERIARCRPCLRGLRRCGGYVSRHARPRRESPKLWRTHVNRPWGKHVNRSAPRPSRPGRTSPGRILRTARRPGISRRTRIRPQHRADVIRDRALRDVAPKATLPARRLAGPAPERRRGGICAERPGRIPSSGLRRTVGRAESEKGFGGVNGRGSGESPGADRSSNP